MESGTNKTTRTPRHLSVTAQLFSNDHSVAIGGPFKSLVFFCPVTTDYRSRLAYFYPGLDAVLKKSTATAVSVLVPISTAVSVSVPVLQKFQKITRQKNLKTNFFKQIIQNQFFSH